MYGDSHALSSDSTIIFPSNIKQKEELASVKREKQLLFMESAANTHYSEFGQHFSCNSNSQSSSGLLRFRSTPTSSLANFSAGGEKGGNLGSMFCSGEANNVHVMSESDDSNCKKRAVNRFTAVNSQLPPQYPRQGGAQMEYRIELDQQGQGKIGSTIVRQNSSPAGLFSHLNSQNGYSGVRGIGSYKIGNPSSSRFRNHMYTSSVLPSSLGMISRINEVENETMGPNGLDEGKVENGSCDGLFLSQECTFSSWNDSSYFAENFTSGIKRELLDNDPKLFADNENREPVNRSNVLSHHLSLPKTSIEMEKLMQLQDIVPCKVRAKRGCATHPRSIAERVRRTRISERMRKLQELVPNMDKQTNTADMLDLAVEYIKSLQKQYKTLSGYQANCKCSAFQKVVSDQTH